MKCRSVTICFILILFLYVPITQAAWVNSGIGQITYVRTYQVGQDGLRVQMGISGATHDCGVTPNTFYFDSNKNTYRCR